jgi:transcriptional regulator with XRE-family HTH domain
MAKNRPYVEVSNLVKNYRIKAGMTQMDLGKKLGYTSPQFVSLFERGMSKIPLETIGQIIVLLKIPDAKIEMILVKIFKVEVMAKISAGKKIASHK